ncbi:PQQ-binding-like beta-propeller repeat protein [Natronomonas marina]|uniref:outer membrane protein assembly factor BamB family protein n=1 Tax=Natronomonas marina TaxID=2961939 RepID=UPI003313A8A7
MDLRRVAERSRTVWGAFFDCISTNDQIIFSDRTGVGAIKRGEPNAEWKFNVGKRNTPQKVVSDSNSVFVATKGVSEDNCHRRGTVHSLQLSNGRENWTFSLPTDIKEVAISEGVIIVGAVGRLCGVDPETGSKIWEKSCLVLPPTKGILRRSHGDIPPD